MHRIKGVRIVGFFDEEIFGSGEDMVCLGRGQKEESNETTFLTFAIVELRRVSNFLWEFLTRRKDIGLERQKSIALSFLLVSHKRIKHLIYSS